MRKRILMAVMVMMLLTGCHTTTRYLGGSMEVELPKGQKLEEVTWKDESIWYLTRPMREDEKPETHTFQQDSEWGVFEGTVTIKESR